MIPAAADTLDRIVAMAARDDGIRAVVLEGSVAGGRHVDELSDYDINLFSRDYGAYLDDDSWLHAIGDVLIYQKETFDFDGVMVPTRLVVYRDRPRVDFSFWQLSLLADMVAGRRSYESYRSGYVVLLDKDGLAAQLPPPDPPGFALTRPTRATFLQLVYNFWFEVYCVAKYLARGDLWYAKLVENRYAKDHLYRLALWHQQAQYEWAPNALLHSEGKRFEQWASPALLGAFGRTFSRYDEEETWQSLLAMVALFNELAQATAALLEVDYPGRVEEDILVYLAQLRAR